jgi:hypothetical protein
MKETIEKAQEELKRVDHLYYVSLKYTKTVDVIKSIIERLINSFDFTIDALFLYMLKKNKIKDIPSNAINRCVEIKKLFKDDPQFIEDIDLYSLLRKLNRAEYTVAREFRKHVTMGATVDDELVDVNVEIIECYFKRAKKFVENAYNLIHGIKDE